MAQRTGDGAARGARQTRCALADRQEQVGAVPGGDRDQGQRPGRAARSVSLWVCKTGKLRLFTVKAGTYEAIPVKCDRYSPTTMRLIEQREWDYAPELGHYVRRVTVNYLRGTSRTVELVAALSGPAASKARLTALARAARQADKVGVR